MRNLRISTKVFGGFGIVIFLTSSFLLTTSFELNMISKDLAMAESESLYFANLAQKMRLDIIQIQQCLTDISATRGQDGLNDGFDKAEKHRTSFLDNLLKFEAKYQQEGVAKSVRDIKNIRKNFELYYKTGVEMASRYVKGGSSAGNKYMPTFDLAAEEMSKSLEPFIEFHIDDLRKSISSASKASEKYKTESVISIVAFIIVAVFIAWQTTVSTVRPIHMVINILEKISKGEVALIPEGKAFDISTDPTKLSETDRLYAITSNMASHLKNRASIATEIAGGDLTQSVKVLSDNDVLGNALDSMNRGLAEIISKTRNMASLVDKGSKKISHSSHQLSTNSVEQASAIEEITSTMVEIAAQTTTNAENATQANSSASSARDGASKGNEEMGEMLKAMSEISESNKNIASIIKVIDDIAFQTNLLALNAAVEAARAGKYGKGFAVVAEEVRALASRSAKAAKETSSLIEGALRNVDNGTRILGKTAESLEKIVAEVSKVTDIVNEISAASIEQSQGINQINEALNQIEQTTHKNTTNAEETDSATSTLSVQASQLLSILQAFKLHERDDSSNFSEGTEQPGVLENRESFAPEPEHAEVMLKPESIINLGDSEFGKF